MIFSTRLKGGQKMAAENFIFPRHSEPHFELKNGSSTVCARTEQKIEEY